MIATRRRRATKGRWMQLRDAGLLAGYMEMKDFSQARLGRYVGCSRQFVHMLVTGEKKTCTPQVGALIEEALGVLPGTLFVPNESRKTRPAVAPEDARPPARRPVTRTTRPAHK